MLTADVAIYAIVRVPVTGLTAASDEALISEAFRRADFSTLPGFEMEICRYEIVREENDRLSIYHDKDFLDGLHADRVEDGAGVFEL